MNGNFRLKKISFRYLLILISLSVVLLFLLAAGGILYFQTKSYINSNIDSISREKLSLITQDIEIGLKRVLDISNGLKINERFTGYLNNINRDDIAPFEKYGFSENIESYLFSIIESSHLIKSVIVVSNGIQYSGNNLALDNNTVKTLNTNDLIQEPEFINMNQGMDDSLLKGNMYFTLSIYVNEKVNARVFILLEQSFINTQVSQKIVLYDESFKTIYKSPVLKNIDSENFFDDMNNSPYHISNNKGEKYVIYHQMVGFNNWHIFYVNEVKEIFSQLNLFNVFTLAALLICFIIVLLFSGIVSKRILSPIIKLSGLLKEYKNGNITEISFYKENKALLSLREKVFVYLIITILLPLLSYILIANYQSKQIIYKQTYIEYNNLSENIANNLEKYIDEKQIMIKRIAYDKSVQQYLYGIDDSLYDNNIKGEIISVLEENRYLGLNYCIVTIYDSEGDNVLSYPYSATSHSEKKIIDLPVASQKIRWSIERIDTRNYFVNLYMPIMSLKEYNSELIGYIRIQIDGIYFTQLFSNLFLEKNILFIMDESENTIFSQPGEYSEASIIHMDQNQSSIITLNNSSEKYIKYTKTLVNYPWIIISLYNYSSIINKGPNLEVQSIYMVTICILLIIIFSLFFSHYLLKPINEINKYFNELDIGNLDKKVKYNYFIDEITTLGETFNNMIERIEDLIEELLISNIKKSKLENEKREAEFKALQAQINPHFLYNTLDTINYMIRRNKQKTAIEMNIALSNLFRFGISREDAMITIKEEIEYARAYSGIMAQRYSNTINFVWKIDESLLENNTIKLILQPIIENAIYHGLLNKTGQRMVAIECKSYNDNIQFVIKDNGIGIPENELEKILCNLEKANNNKIGIYNVQSRIRLYFGDNYGLRIESVYNEGTSVYITIPEMREETPSEKEL